MNAVDLFCGAGGFSAGLEAAGINVAYGVDIADHALTTFETNHAATVIAHDLSEGLPAELHDEAADIIFGSPPCQGFSDARGERSLDDERNQLVFSFIQAVEQLQPRYVLMENVAGMTTISDAFLDAIEAEYDAADDLLCVDLGGRRIMKKKTPIAGCATFNVRALPLPPPATIPSRSASHVAHHRLYPILAPNHI